MKIKFLPEEERPIEKCLSQGIGSLSNRELLARIKANLRRNVSEPQGIDETQLLTFNNLTISVRKKGANILRGGEEVERHLDMVGADASTIGDTILFRQDVCISEVLEETYHFMQNFNHINEDKPEPLRT